MATTTATEGMRIGDYAVEYDPAGDAARPWVVTEDGAAVEDFRTRAQAVRAATRWHVEALRDRIGEAADRCDDAAALEAAMAILRAAR